MCKYNSKYKILFNWNPSAQCVLGKFFGWMLVFEAYVDSRTLKKDDEILFSFNNQSQFNSCVKHIQKMI